MAPSPEPIRKSSLPCTPSAEYEFVTVRGGQPDSLGVLLVPNDDTGPVVVRRRVTYGDWEPVRPNHWADEPAAEQAATIDRDAIACAPECDVCRPVDVDGETIRVRGQGELTAEGQEALADLVRAAKAKFVAEAPEQVGVLQKRLRLAHQARRAKEHQLDGIRRALCDAGFMEDDDPYSHADLADVIRQNGEALHEVSKPAGDADDIAPFNPTAADEDTVPDILFDENVRRHRAAIDRVNELLASIERVRALATRLEEFAENALKDDDRKLYASLASDLRTRIGDPNPGDA